MERPPNAARCVQAKSPAKPAGLFADSQEESKGRRVTAAPYQKMGKRRGSASFMISYTRAMTCSTLGLAK